MDNQAAQNRAEIARIKNDLAFGKITYTEAQEQAAPTLKRINEKAKELAKKYNRRHRDITFAEIMR